jgi:undecaprenyl-diphosphatase
MELDQTLFQLLNGFAGRWYGLDLFFAMQEDNNLLKGALFLAGFVWFWFRRTPDPRPARVAIINTLPSVFVALFLNRLLSVCLPFRVRPMYDPSVLFNDPHVDVVVHFNMENWSSFPSDTATFFFAMVAGFWLISRRAAIAYGIYSLLFVLATRIYLGLHWPSDILVGAVIGAATTLALNAALGDRLARPLLTLEARMPQLLYALGFYAAFEVGAMLEDVRRMPRAPLMAFFRSANAELQASPLLASMLLATLGVLATVAAALILRSRRRGAGPLERWQAGR